MQVQRTLELAAALNQHQTNAAAAAAANQHAQLVAHMDKAVANSGSSFCDVTHQQCVGGGGGGGSHNSHHAKLCRCVSCVAATHANGGAKVLTREEEFILKYGLLANNSGSQSNSATAVKENTYPLRVWLEENRDNPYPTKSEKLMLSIVTKMTLTQVSTWFANARRRLKKERRPEHDFLHDFYPFSLYPPLITAPQFYPPPTAAIPKILPTAAANLIGPQPAAIQPIRVLPINHQGLSPTAIHEYLLSHREALNSLGLPSSVDPGRPKIVHQELPAQIVVNKEAERIQTVIVNKPIITETTTTTTASIPKPSVNAPTERSRFSNISPDVQVIKSANEVHRPPRENISQLHNKNVNKSPAKNIWSIVDTVKTAKTK